MQFLMLIKIENNSDYEAGKPVPAESASSAMFSIPNWVNSEPMKVPDVAVYRVGSSS